MLTAPPEPRRCLEGNGRVIVSSPRTEIWSYPIFLQDLDYFVGHTVCFAQVSDQTLDTPALFCIFFFSFRKREKAIGNNFSLSFRQLANAVSSQHFLFSICETRVIIKLC